MKIYLNPLPAQRGLCPSSMPRRVFGKPFLPSDWYLGSLGIWKEKTLQMVLLLAA